ncbi:aminotransferase [Dongia sp.]|jgi:N-succinyldiaminopimelate aminotransferase|uniref:aminotransferase n=1 Tax=Dongia sp. TaxID=1977262 RepID=UPI0034A24939
MNPIFAQTATSVFETMSRLARQFDAVNLGQGFPDDPGPQDVRQKAADAVMTGWNQYPPMLGIPDLRQSIARHYKRFHQLDLDWENEVMVTSGATEALAGALLALIEPGDEVVLFQPMYDAYLPLVKRAGGIPRFVTLRPPHWRIDEDQLRSVFNKKTRVVLLNNPLNPTGSVFPREDLDLLARYVVEHDSIVVCDEVWEHVLFDNVEHTPLLTLPSLRDRAVKIGSAGKIFSLTGWKVGFVCAAPEILRVLAKAHQYITFTTPPNLQAAVAYGLDKEDSYFMGSRRDFQAARDRFATGLERLGLSVLPSSATYFLNVDLTRGRFKGLDDNAFSTRLVEEARVASIPVSAFYAEQSVTSVVRFCFAKKFETLDEALKRLAAFMARL